MKDLKEIAENFRAKEERANVIQDLSIDVRLNPRTVKELVGAIATLAERLGDIETRFEGLLEYLGLAANGAGVVKRYAPGAEAGIRIETSPMVQHNARSNFGSQEAPITLTDGEAHPDGIPKAFDLYGNPISEAGVKFTATDGEARTDPGVPVEVKSASGIKSLRGVRPGDLYTTDGEDVWRVLYQSDHPTITLKNLETGKQRGGVVGSPILSEFVPLVKKQD